MAVDSRGGRTAAELQIPKRWKDRETSPERTKVWTEPPPKLKSLRKVPVVYYLSRNGQLEQPHFMEVPLSSPDGLFLRDVIERLNLLRGKGMACKYSWSSKRSYKNGFVWHDLSENDFIHPAHGHEYVLKGSELLTEPSFNPNILAIASSRSLAPPPLETQTSGDDSDFPTAFVRRRNQSWSSIDLQEYKVYKTESVGDSAGKAAADASTQTDDKSRRRRRAIREEKEERAEEAIEEEGGGQREVCQSQSTELSREEISPPPSDSSPETLESLMKSDGRLVFCGSEVGPNRTAQNCPGGGGRMKASTVLMQLLSCGTISFKDCGATYVKDEGLSLIGQYKARLPRGAGNQDGALAENSNLQRVKLEDKEYFSGSLIETKKEEVPALKRSSSYNADRSSKLQFADEGVRAKCIPRKPKTLSTKKESNIITSSGNGQGGSKRFEVQQQQI